jgi:hypothetical protein
LNLAIDPSWKYSIFRIACSSTLCPAPSSH